jgi:inhibitor of KinA
VDCPQITTVSEQAILVRFGARASPAVHERVQAAVRHLDAGRHRWLVDCVPGFASLLVVLDPSEVSVVAAREEVLLAVQAPANRPGDRTTILVPVWYDSSVGPDLEEVARLRGLSVADVVALHAGRDYLVYVLGFKPGFPYMASIHDALVTPRRDTPRLSVPPGSVAIAGRQTGIYTVGSPGGWRILGRTPWRVFDPGRSDPFLIKAGDIVRFEPIGRERFLELEREGR